MRTRLWFVILAGMLVLSLVLSGCGQSATPEPKPSTPPATPPAPPAKTALDVRGSDTMVNLGAAWAEAFMSKNKTYSVAVQGGGSGTGISSLANKNCDIAQTSRAIKTAEIETAQKNGVSPKEFIVAYDGVAMIVHPSNPVKQLSVTQLAKIFRGEATSWKEFGGKDEKIVVLSRDTASGTHVFIKEHIVQERATKTTAEYGKDVRFMTSTQAIVNEVSTNTRAIGYVGLGYLSDKVKAVGVKKDDSSPAVLPSAASVKDKTYDLSRPLFMYTNGTPTGIVKAYIDFVMSAEGQQIVAKLDFVPVN